jgi:large subunit ribosomal protein L21
MYAVIKTGGKQQKVQVGDVIEVEKLVHEGESITFQPLLVVDDDGKTHVGKDAAKASVTAKPLGEKKGEKIKIFKYRPKTGYAQRGGHRQMRTLLEIEGVALSGGRSRPSKADAEPKASKPAAKKSTAAKPAAKETAAKKAATAKKPTTAKKTTAKKATTAKKPAAAKKSTAKPKPKADSDE